jgi:hypothetical protein
MDLIAELPQTIDRPVELNAGNAEDVGNAFEHELTREGLAASKTHRDIPLPVARNRTPDANKPVATAPDPMAHNDRRVDQDQSADRMRHCRIMHR